MFCWYHYSSFLPFQNYNDRIFFYLQGRTFFFKQSQWDLCKKRKFWEYYLSTRKKSYRTIFLCLFIIVDKGINMPYLYKTNACRIKSYVIKCRIKNSQFLSCFQQNITISSLIDQTVGFTLNNKRYFCCFLTECSLV